MDLKTLQDEAVALLERLVATPSVSRDEGRTADLLAAHLAAHGVTAERLHNNLHARCAHFDPAKPTLLLNSHHDTVRPAATWTREPFAATWEGDRLYGLGANDAGGSVVALTETFLHYYDVELPFNLVLALSAEEECMGEHGSRALLPVLGPIDMALVGEPTRMQAAVGERGLVVLDCTAHGKAGHAARNEGENAIYKALDDICWFKDFKFPKVSPLLGPVKTTVTVINAGTQHNVIPEKCVFTVDVRTNECYTNHEIFDEIVRNVKSEVKARSFRLNSSSVSPDHPIVRKAVEMGLEPFGSPTLSDQALMNFPSVKIGPGSSSRSHTADEFICVDEIAGAINLYVRLLDGLDLQG